MYDEENKSLWEIGREFNRHSGARPLLATTLARAQLELTEALEASEPGHCLEEIADVVLVLAAGCHFAGMDLDTAIKNKHAVNMKRKWEPHPDLPGAVRRVK